MNKHFIIDPAGVRHTIRNSKSRVYSHAVIFMPSYDYAVEQAAKPRSWMKSNYQFARDLAEGRKSYNHIGDAAANVAEGVEKMRGCDNAEDYVQLCIKEAQEHVEMLRARGYYDNWIVEGWNGRLDLAQKSQAQVYGRPGVKEAHIVVAELV